MGAGNRRRSATVVRRVHHDGNPVYLRLKPNRYVNIGKIVDYFPIPATLFTPSFAGTIPRRTRMPLRSSSPAAFCGSPICRISHLIALAAMKPLSGVKPVASYTPSRHWTGVNHKNECGVVGSQVKVRSNTSNQLGGRTDAPLCAHQVMTYGAALWRQLAQILFPLDALDRRKPQERTRRFFAGSVISSIPDDEAYGRQIVPGSKSVKNCIQTHADFERG